MATPLLELKGVSKAFGGLQVISNLDLHVNEHEIVSVIGPNGAGKTTLFNLVTGVYAPDGGRHPLRGRVDRRACRRTRSRAAASRAPSRRLRLFLNMTVKENVMAAEYGHTHAGIVRSVLRTPGMRREEREIAALAEEKLSFFGQRLMGYRWDQPAYSLSYANRRRLEIARAMATNARLLLLDEPAAGMNPVETHEITELIGKLREELGYTIFVIEHDMHLVEGISDRVIALDHGIKIAEGSFDEVATDPSVVEAYLGLRAEGGVVSDGQAAARVRARRHLLRADPHPQRRLAAGRRGRARLPAGRQRVGQVDDPEDRARDRAAPRAAACSSTARISPSTTRATASAAGWRSCPRTGGCSRR